MGSQMRRSRGAGSPVLNSCGTRMQCAGSRQCTGFCGSPEVSAYGAKARQQPHAACQCAACVCKQPADGRPSVCLPACPPVPPSPAAAIARRVYINQGMGVGAFRRAFGGRTNAAGGVNPEHHAKAAGGVIRHALQQLEAMGLVEKNPAARGGRRITPEGQRQVGRPLERPGHARSSAGAAGLAD